MVDTEKTDTNEDDREYGEEFWSTININWEAAEFDYPPSPDPPLDLEKVKGTGIMQDITAFQLSLLYLIKMMDEPAYGRQIQIAAVAMTESRISNARIYPNLTELEEGGYIDKDGQGRQHTYTLTPKGNLLLEKHKEFFNRAFDDESDAEE